MWSGEIWSWCWQKCTDWWLGWGCLSYKRVLFMMDLLMWYLFCMRLSPMSCSNDWNVAVLFDGTSKNNSDWKLIWLYILLYSYVVNIAFGKNVSYIYIYRLYFYFFSWCFWVLMCRFCISTFFSIFFFHIRYCQFMSEVFL